MISTKIYLCLYNLFNYQTYEVFVLSAILSLIIVDFYDECPAPAHLDQFSLKSFSFIKKEKKNSLTASVPNN